MKITTWEPILQKIQDFEFKKGITSFVNPYSMLLLKNEADIITEVDQWCIDGISFVKCFNIILNKNISRFSFDDTSVAAIVFPIAKRENLKIAIIGTKEYYIRSAVSNIEAKYDIKVTMFRNGYFDNSEERKQCLLQILLSRIDIVICGMGTPHQERLLIDLAKIGWNGYGFTCGGYLHQIAKKKNYYPTLMNKLNIRWAYRVFDEPKLLKRYFLYYPIFFLQFIISLKILTKNKLQKSGL